jgi:hypothetical protein
MIVNYWTGPLSLDEPSARSFLIFLIAILILKYK